MGWRRRIMALVAAVTVPVLSSCTPATRLPGPDITSAELNGDFFLTRDGAKLPLKSWIPKGGHPRAVLIVLHGFNDYSNFFAAPGAYFATRGIASYAYDQRGFGAAPDRGFWPGTDALTRDLQTLSTLVHRRHPGIPLYWLGESMGGAVVMVAAATKQVSRNVNGVILAAPAIWGRETMPWYQTTALWLSAHTIPGVTLSGQGLNILPSDNIEMLRALGRDPLVIKETRIDTLYGLAGLMDSALAASARLTLPALILYGRHDEIIPGKPTRLMLTRLPSGSKHLRKVILYEHGYHMLLRDLEAKKVWSDIKNWVLPSGGTGSG